MAITNFVPEIWSAKSLAAISRKSVALAVTNNDYEGDIANAGDTVNITAFDDPTVNAYVAHTDITVEDVDDTTLALLIDQQNYVSFEVDDVEKAQSLGGVLAKQTLRGAYRLANTMDVNVLSVMGLGASASAPDHQIAEATISTATDAYDALVDWGVMLDDADVPEWDRFAIITPAFHGLIRKDSRFIASGDEAGAALRRNGVIGEAAGFVLHKSNNLPDGPGAGAGKSIITGSQAATTLAQQIVSMKAFEQEKRFNEAVKGLHVFGRKVLRPEFLVSADVIVA